MQREITDGEGTTWTLIQAYAGLTTHTETENDDAAQVEGEDKLRHVVCTPSGGAQTVRLKLPDDWEEKLSDDELLRELEAARN